MNQEGWDLVADIGGTNARLSVAKPENGGLQLTNESVFSCDDFETFEEVVAHYLEKVGGGSGLFDAVLAVAGPVSANSAHLTNRDWLIDGDRLVSKGLFASCVLLNDFAALAHALPLLEQGELKLIGARAQEPATRAEGTKLVVGPGTGLGAAFLKTLAGTRAVLEGEGGHISFAPVDRLERELLVWFLKKYQRVSVERLLSGPGLRDLYQAMAEIEGRISPALEAAAIVEQGVANDGAERETLLRFCALLGSFAGDLTLAGGAWDGVYIGGGIVPRIPELLAASSFRQRFEAKGRFLEKMRLVPSWLITAPAPALKGAASKLPYTKRL